MLNVQQGLVALAVLGGGVGGNALGVPAGYLVGGFVGGLLAKGATGLDLLPGGEAVTVVGQVLVAYAMVCSADLSAWRAFPRLLPVAVLSAAVLTAASLVLAKVLEKVCHLDPMTALFSTPPGGLTGLAVAGASMGSDSPISLLFQMVRLIFVLLVIPFVASWWTRW
ncbi:MAG TPA: AbrB family transcriptional regulator [Synergistaceae bacterium]|nr:AbrB family transcriptional regulator [Synergistaceae bacterium]